MFDGVKIEVHLSNPYAREAWRHHSVIVAGRRRHDHRLARRRATASRSTRPPARSGRSERMSSRDRRTARPARRRAAARPPARAPRRRRRRRAARDQARQRALPHRVHRLGRDAARHAATTRCSSPTAATPSSAHEQLDAAGRRRARIEIGLTGAAQRAVLAARGRAGRAARARGAQRHLGAAARVRRPRSRASSSCPRARSSRTLRRVKDAGEIDRIRRACAIADDAFQSLLPRSADGIDRARSSRSRSSSRCASVARAATASIRSSRPARTARSRTHVPSRSRHRAQRARRVRLRLHRRGLLLRHDPHRVASAIPAPTRAISTTSCSRASRPGARWSPPTSRAPRSTGRRATSSPTPAGPRRSRTRPVTASGLEIHEAPRVAATGR